MPYVPGFGSTITVRHLILHTSGLRNYYMLLSLGGQSMEGQGRITQQQVVNLVSRQEAINFPPGSDYAYNNTGYVLLAEIVFRVTGQTLRDFTTERIFTPLKMERSFFFDDVTEIVPHRANSYTRRRYTDGQEAGGWARMPLNFEDIGAGGLFSTVEELARWAGNFVEPVIGDRTLVEQMCTNGALDDGTPINYGFGLEHGEINGHTTVSHTGSDAAFRSTLVHFPDHDFAVAILANTELNLMSKVEAIAEHCLPEVAVDTPSPLNEDTNADLSRFTGTYVPAAGITIRLEVHDASLVCHAGRGEPRKLIARIDGGLDFGSPGAQSLIPIRDAAGNVTGLEGAQTGHGIPQRWQRIEVHETPTTSLAEYAGEYRSSELDITYSIHTEDGRLLLGHLWRNRPLALSPVLPDRFESPGNRFAFELMMTLIFQRNAEGRIDGLLMHTVRDRNIRFDRVSNARVPLPTASTQAWGTWG